MENKDFNHQRKFSIGMRGQLNTNLFDASPQQCFRCGVFVYQTEKLGPVNDVIFHRNCFRCLICGLNLTLQSYCTNQIDNADRDIYCQIHQPKCVARAIDIDAVGVRSAVNAQHIFNTAQNKDSVIHRGGKIDGNALNIKHSTGITRLRTEASVDGSPSNVPFIDLQAVGIQGAINAQKLMTNKQFTHGKAKLHANSLFREREEKIYKAQSELEKKHRTEETDLLQTILKERELEVKKIDEEVLQTWEKRLLEMTSKFREQIERKKLSKEEIKSMTLKFEKEKADALESMKLSQNHERQKITADFMTKERSMTSEMVSRQSKEMIHLIVNKELEIATEIGIDIDELIDKVDFDVDESMNELDSGHVNNADFNSLADTSNNVEFVVQNSNSLELNENVTTEVQNSIDIAQSKIKPALVAVITPAIRVKEEATVIQPNPPSCPKKALYTSPEVFHELDQRVIELAEFEQATFTELVRQLTATCSSDLEKVRAIFRWITIKNLSTMELDTCNSSPDTPMGVLRGIKNGTETYHLLFMRLCSYAGICCEEVKGYSKSVGFEPGMRFGNSTKFTNTWNVVCIDSDWRFVQCNWAARHLVFNRNVNSSFHKDHADKLRYQYDEHYFLTDPEKFIMEFFPFDTRWQLIDKKLSLQNFEDLPFVRSAFFHFGMSFMADTRAVLETNEFGGTKFELLCDELDDIVCHYQLRFADEERKKVIHYQGSKLERYVLLSMNDSKKLLFDIHVPTKGAYFLEIFATKLNPENREAAQQQVNLKCVCKFKIVCRQLDKCMSPLPNSASSSSEWGPAKATRNFNIKAVTHGSPIISVNDTVELKFWIPDNLLQSNFSVMLHKNNVNNHLLSRFHRMSLDANMLSIQVMPPETGQYAMDVLMKRKEDAAVNSNGDKGPLHLCKYLINCTRVSQTRQIYASLYVDEEKVKSGPTSAAKMFGLHLKSDMKSKCFTNMSSVPIEFGVKESLEYGYKFTKRYDLNLNEDHTDNVDIKILDGSVKFCVHFVNDGRYQFHVFAKRAISSQFEHVYTFKIEKLTNLLQ